MAKVEIVEMVDDRDGRTPAVETLEFRFEGVDHVIDLNAKNAERFRKQMRPWCDAASQKSGPKRARKAPRPRQGGGNRPSNKELRAWAQRQGLAVGDRGRIPREIEQAFRAEQRHK